MRLNTGATPQWASLGLLLVLAQLATLVTASFDSTDLRRAANVSHSCSSHCTCLAQHTPLINDHIPNPDYCYFIPSTQDSLLWGTYRPQLYHGIRARIPKSLMTGLMWHGLNDYPSHRGQQNRNLKMIDILTTTTQTPPRIARNPSHMRRIRRSHLLRLHAARRSTLLFPRSRRWQDQRKAQRQVSQE
jgi:hypothetical protein